MTEEQPHEYLPLELDTLKAELIAGFSIYVQAPKGYALYRESGTSLDEASIEQLRQAGVQVVYVKADDTESLEEYLQRFMRATFDDPGALIDEKARGIELSWGIVARQILRRPTALQINRARPIIEMAVAEMENAPELTYELLLNTETSFSLPSHLVNSSVFTIAMCGPLTISKPSEKQALALSAFLHDIGKALLPEHLLQKSGKLSTAEWAQMRQHSLLGCNLLSTVKDVPGVVAEAARSHHERIDQQGYPDGLGGDAIPFAGRVAAVVDVFNALTTDTPFRKRLNSFEAITAMREQMKGQFDVEVLRALVHTLAEQSRAPAS